MTMKPNSVTSKHETIASDEVRYRLEQEEHLAQLEANIWPHIDHPLTDQAERSRRMFGGAPNCYTTKK